MKLELKKVSFSESLSDDSNAFTADVHIDGVKRATASNHGHGGPTDVHAYAKPRQSPQGDEAYFQEKKLNKFFLNQYEAWAKTQPAIETDLPTEGGGKFSYPHTLEADVDLWLEQWLTAEYARKGAARMKRMCGTKWVFTLKEKDGKPVEANTLFMIVKRPGQLLAVVAADLRKKHGANLLEILNEQYQ